MATICEACDSRSLSATDSAHDDLALVHACRRGEVHAFEELVKRHERKLFRIAQHVTANREDAQDVVQEAFLNAFRKLDQFQENSQFSTWLVRITINQSLMKVRKAYRTKEATMEMNSQDEAGELVLEPVDPAPSPEEAFQQTELKQILVKALQKLRPALSLVFVLRDIEGMSIEETSRALEISQVAVKTRLLRARLQLRELLCSFKVLHCQTAK